MKLDKVDQTVNIRKTLRGLVKIAVRFVKFIAFELDVSQKGAILSLPQFVSGFNR